MFDAQSLAQCGHAASPTPSPRDHLPHRRLWASQSLPGSGIFDFTERYRKLMSTMVSCSSQILMGSLFIICLFLFLLGKTHQFQILPIISFSMFPTCSSYPHYLQFKSNIITLYVPLYPHYLHLSPVKNPCKPHGTPLNHHDGCLSKKVPHLHLRGACIHRGVRHVKRSPQAF